MIGERFLLDTGGAGPLLVYDYFARPHPEAVVDAHGGGARSQQLHLYGIGGEVETRPYQLASVKLGNVNFTDVLAYRIAGDKVLRWFTVGFDYAHERVYLTPSDEGRAILGL